MPSCDVSAQLSALVRADGGRLLALLASQLRDLVLAEDCLQEAYASALVHWVGRGLPSNPPAWLLQVARRKAIDRLRRAKTADSKAAELAFLLDLEADAPEADEDYVIPDERLRLIFVCCHPALDRQARVALTLRSLCGLTTDEIASAFLLSPTTMAQRLVRAQQKISKAGIPFEVPGPDDWPQRIETVLAVIYLIFNAGYASSGQGYIRVDLCEEAVRLARIVWSLAPTDDEAGGLLALLLLQQSRFVARLDKHGALVPLEHQDRSQWDATKIREGVGLLQTVLRRGRPGPYQLQAAIAAIHCEAPSFAETDWSEIILIYERLYALAPNPVVALNLIAARAQREDATVLLPTLDGLEDALAAYQPFHAVRADLLVKAGQYAAAALAFDQAIALSKSAAEQDFLRQRRGLLPR